MCGSVEGYLTGGVFLAVGAIFAHVLDRMPE